jgi:zinc-binding alcohol dehydrogenase family protein
MSSPTQKQQQAIRFLPGGGPAASSLELTTLPKPTPGPTDLLIQLRACAINPIDTKVRSGAFASSSEITGFDGAGIVEALGSSVRGFDVGDEVYFCGALGRQGTNAQYSLVEHRVVARKPRCLGWAEAACVPLVTLTAWELLEEHFGLVAQGAVGNDEARQTQGGKSILIINGAGGVGSAATQLARRVFGLGRVVVTASRPETEEHVRQMGATHVISHREDLKRQLKEKVGIESVEYIFICHGTNPYMSVAVDVASPKGKIGSIVEVVGERLDGMHSMEAFMKQLSFHWEVVLSKPEYKYELESQGDILKRAAKLYDDGVLLSLMRESDVLSVQSLIKAHEKIESGRTIGKIGLEIRESIQ